MHESLVAEIVSFRAAPGVSPEAMRKLAHGIGDWLAARPGFIARTLSQSPDGIWTDHVIWASHDQAMAAGALIMSEPSAQPFMQAIAPDSVTMSHAPVALRQLAA